MPVDNSMIVFDKVTKIYGKTQKALDEVSLQIDKGEFVFLSGNSGAGKTTLLELVLRDARPDKGDIWVNGIELGSLRERQVYQYRRYIGMVFQDFRLFQDFTVYENVAFAQRVIEAEKKEMRSRVREVLRQVGLEDKLDFFVDGLSRGMKQRLCLARALIHDPAILILDEPTSGLDPRTRFEFREILKELQESGKTIVISSHVLSELSELCTDIGIIDQGRMVLEGNIDDILSRVNTSNPLVISVFTNIDKELSILKSHPCVQTISLREQDICVRFAGDAQDEALLLQQLIDSDVLVNGFTREKGSLESVFMQLTEHEEERVVLSYDAKSGL